MVAELLERRVAVIVANNPGNIVAKEATTTVPIVFTTGGDPIKVGLVTNLNRPGGNVTGATQLATDLMPKRVELIHQLVPTATDVAVLLNPGNPLTPGMTSDVQATARAIGIRVHVLHASTPGEIDAAFEKLPEIGAGAIVIANDTYFVSQAARIAERTVRHAVRAIFQDRQFVEAGGLASCGGSNSYLYRQAGIYAGRILKGAKPGDLPVVQITNIDLTINVRTARMLGLTLPPLLLGRAQEVIE